MVEIVVENTLAVVAALRHVVRPTRDLDAVWATHRPTVRGAARREGRC
jgi:hypothetical protein